MEITQEEKEILLFIIGIGDKDMLKEYLFGNLDKKIILDRMKYVLSNSLTFRDWDDTGTYQNYYECVYCGLGQHKGVLQLVYSDDDLKMERRCQNKKYFKHSFDCPVLIAKDFLMGVMV